MTETKINEAAQAIKEHLIQLAADDKLPLDMTELDATFIVDIIEKHQPTARDKAIEHATHYLSDTFVSVEEQVEAIAQQAEEDGSEMIDNVEGVLVWEPLEELFDCDEFLQMIGW